MSRLGCWRNCMVIRDGRKVWLIAATRANLLINATVFASVVTGLEILTHEVNPFVLICCF